MSLHIARKKDSRAHSKRRRHAVSAAREYGCSSQTLSTFLAYTLVDHPSVLGTGRHRPVHLRHTGPERPVAPCHRPGSTRGRDLDLLRILASPNRVPLGARQQVRQAIPLHHSWLSPHLDRRPLPSRHAPCCRDRHRGRLLVHVRWSVPRPSPRGSMRADGPSSLASSPGTSTTTSPTTRRIT